MDILRDLRQYQEQEKALYWEGTFADYLNLVQERPEICRLAHARVYNMIKDAGVEEKDGYKEYKFFPLNFLACIKPWKGL